MTIRQLPQFVADAIAAGEVVERPAAVVKELCENAVDAGAAAVDVVIDGGGLVKIVVVDNGSGIPTDQLELAVARHATSKITAIDDLFAIQSLGFRGEALASIAAVSSLTLSSRHVASPRGAFITVVGSDVTERGVAAISQGTRVDVSDLFLTTPARMRFLRSAKTEVQRAVRIVSDLALIHPEVAFTCTVDGRIAVRSPGGQLHDAVRAIFGGDADKECVDVDASDGDITISGVISEPRAHRSNRNSMVVAVNRRRIHNRAINAAIEEAYRNLLPIGRFAFGVLSIDIDPTSVDVNVHPTKREVRFRDERAVFSAVQKACWSVLRSAQSYVGDISGVVVPRPVHSGAFSFGGFPQMTARDTEKSTALWSALLPSAEAAPSTQGDEADHRIASICQSLRPMAQLHNAWIVGEYAGGIVLIDQHAAHEKVLYARLRQRWASKRNSDDTSAQLLTIPEVIELTPHEMQLADEYHDVLVERGFDIEEFGPNLLRCCAAPTRIRSHDVATVLRDILATFDEPVVAEREHRLAALIACHSAIRFGDTVTTAEQVQLVTDLAGTDGAATCPHGRPTMMIFDEPMLRSAFRRPR